MDFKKVSQIIWMILAFLFIVVSFLRVQSESIYIDRLPSESNILFFKHNKITGAVYVWTTGLDQPRNGKWIKLEPK